MSTALVPRYDPFVAMDRLDDELILAELQGRIADALAYSFEQGGKQVVGLSKAGVDATVREMAKQGEVIREMSLDWRDNGDEVLFTAKAGRYVVKTDNESGQVIEVLMDTAFGCKRQSKKMPKGGDNPFWFEQGSMKAARNARMRLIREDLKQQVIALAAKQGKTRRLSAEDAPPDDAPPAGSSMVVRMPYGHDKGKPVSEATTDNLVWMLGTLTEDKLNDPRWGKGNRALKAAIEAELDAREAQDEDAPEDEMGTEVHDDRLPF